MFIIGIDPGISGAICFFEQGEVKDIIEMPSMTEGKKNKRQINGPQMFNEIEKWTKTKTKFEVMEVLNPLNVPCGPVLSMKELSEEPSLRASGTVVEVDHPTRGSYLSVGCPVKLSDSPVEVTRSPLLGEHTEDILEAVLCLDKATIEAAKSNGAL